MRDVAPTAGQGAPEASWAAGDALKEFQNETRRLPGVALTAIANMLGAVATSLHELEAHAEALRVERDRESKFRDQAVAEKQRTSDEYTKLYVRFRDEQKKVRRLQAELRKCALGKSHRAALATRATARKR